MTIPSSNMKYEHEEYDYSMNQQQTAYSNPHAGGNAGPGGAATASLSSSCGSIGYEERERR